jgi:hypothetical protein
MVALACRDRHGDIWSRGPWLVGVDFLLAADWGLADCITLLHCMVVDKHPCLGLARCGGGAIQRLLACLQQVVTLCACGLPVGLWFGTGAVSRTATAPLETLRLQRMTGVIGTELNTLQAAQQVGCALQHRRTERTGRPCGALSTVQGLAHLALMRRGAIMA